MEHQLLIQQTEKVKEYLKRIDAIYEKARETGEERDFYSIIKPFVEEVHAILEDWSENASIWVQKNDPKNLYSVQIEAAMENMKEICVQAFFPKTSYSRFKHHIHSINYILEKLIEEINKVINSRN